jgi:hypothetical protein
MWKGLLFGAALSFLYIFRVAAKPLAYKFGIIANLI